MSEELATTTEEPAATTETTPIAPPPADTPAAPPAVPDWLRALDHIPDDDLRRHPKVAGIAGSIAERQQRQWEAQQRADSEAKAAESARLALREKARLDPEAFAQDWLQDQERTDFLGELDTVRATERDKIVKAIGRGFAKVPEWSEMTADDFTRLSNAVSGVAEDEQLAAFNAEAAAIIGGKQAEKRIAARAAAEAEKHAQSLTVTLAQEREAIRAQILAEQAAGTPAPSLANGKRAARATDEPPFNSDAWDRWYERKYKSG